jgi:peptide/nickel transport system permease protein
MKQESYWKEVWKQLLKHRLGYAALCVFFLFVVVGVYAPFFASSKPLVVQYDGKWYFPLFRYLFYSEFFTKRLDIFFNILMFTLPAFLISFKLLKKYPAAKKWATFVFLILQFAAFLYFIYKTPQDPTADVQLIVERQLAIKKETAKGQFYPSWHFDLTYMNPYARLNLVIREILRKRQNEQLEPYRAAFERANQPPMPTLWNLQQAHEQREIEMQRQIIATSDSNSSEYKTAESKLNFILDRRHWLEEQIKKVHGMVMPLVSDFHWEDDAGGSQALNQVVPWWDLTRINRKDLLSALIFGIRISLSVGIIAVGISLIIGIPIGAFAGFYGGTFDIITCRLLEIWESMPTFFMLLIVVAMMQSKSIFIVITVIGLFSWTTFTRFIRGEFFKQRHLPYVEACQAQGFNDLYIMFSHILPNAIPPVLTLLPFSIMAAITSEAGLSFLGLGEEGSCSWGVLMDEGRTAFPGESYLLWPPAILLTVLLVAIALVGDALRDAIDPKLRRV